MGKEDSEDIPWVEKYRPQQLSDVVSQGDTVRVLSRSLEAQSVPHLLFYGAPGTGKTSSIIALAKQLYGYSRLIRKELYKQRVLELNASDERGIDVVRTKIKNFAKIAVSSKGPSFKLIILDEADSMTADAQAALRRTMETYSKVTRFCLICNYLSRIIEPLASRCAKFRFKPLEMNTMIDRLEYIAREENMGIERETLAALVEVSEGDLRQAITLLQTCKGYSSTLGPSSVFEMTGTIPQQEMEKLFGAWDTRKVDTIKNTLSEVLLQGYSGLQLLSQIHKELVQGSRFSKTQKAKLAIEIAKVEKRLFDGADEELQLLQLLCCA